MSTREITVTCEECGHDNVVEVAITKEPAMATPIEEQEDSVPLRGAPRDLPLSVPLDGDD